MRIPQPFIPLRVESCDYCHTVRVIGRDYTFGADGLLKSLVSQGHELLAAPMRLVCIEDGEPSVWDDDYSVNESECFIQSRTDEKAILCGAKQSERFIIDTCTTVHYDGNIDVDLKVMTRGQTVAQRLGIADTKPLCYKMERLWLEIPLKQEICTMFHINPNSDLKLADGTTLPMTHMSMSGKIPKQSVGMPFKALLWVGNDERGLGWYAEKDRNWQPADMENAIELVYERDMVILRIRLLDSQPVSWEDSPEKGSRSYLPIDFQFGFQVTPVKPFPKQPYIHNAFHLDCGIKIKGNYIDFLSQENRFDRLKEKGVTTLILHEKWNKSQNWFELSEFTTHQICQIVDECHKRGIRVLTYFGYEMSSMAPVWSEKSNIMLAKGEDRKGYKGGWWRVPFQRDYVVCYSKEYEDCFIDGIAKIMDTCHIDGVYLDGTDYPRKCYSIEHGCGWYDQNGNLHGTYPLKAIRRLFKRLYAVVEQRGGMINVHSSENINFTALPYIHQTWRGEHLQFALVKGVKEDVNLDYFRTEYTGRNMGVPVEFIAYENRPLWKFESALSMAILHGILPRPNDIGHPLDLMSGVWKIFDQFPVAQSEWKPYWNNTVMVDHEKVRVSYYRFTTLAGETQLLAFVANISAQTIEKVSVKFDEAVSKVMDMEIKENVGFNFDLEPYGYRILFVR